MPADNKLELVVTVEVDKANQSIKSVNVNLSNLEQTAAKSAQVASRGVGGMTASMVKGATAGNLFADAIKKALAWAKEWTVDAAKLAEHEARLEASGRALATAHGIAADVFERSVEAVRKVGYHGEDAIHTIDRLIIAHLDLSKVTGLAKLAKDAAAIENGLLPRAQGTGRAFHFRGRGWRQPHRPVCERLGADLAARARGGFLRAGRDRLKQVGHTPL